VTDRPPALRRALAELRPGHRFLAALATWTLIAASQPGLGRPEGFGHTAFVALAPWAYFAARPGRRAFLAEWLAASLGLCATFWWMRHLLPWLVPLLGLVPAVYVGLAGMALRRLARRHPLALAAPAAWMLGELLRWFLPSPASFGWWRLGSFAHATPWLAGSARVWGTWGLTWVFAAFAGWLADLWRTRRLRLDEAPAFPMARVHVLGLGPLVAGLCATIAVPAPASEPGPRLLLVQPGIEQELKAAGRDPLGDLYAGAVDLTVKGLAAAGEPAPDLVCWGETMYPIPLVAEDARAAFARGARRIALARATDEVELAFFEAGTRALVGGVLFGRPEGRRGAAAEWLRELARAAPSEWVERARRGERLLPEGTAFLTGIEQWVEHGEHLRSRNAVALWDARGELAGVAAKLHLVPVAESSDLYSGFPWVVDLVRRAGGFVPDFVPAPRTGVLELATAAGRAFRFSCLVCYDNVFDDAFDGPLRRGEQVDFHLVVSNEAWYGDSVEMDHMVAFSRLQALCTGRSVVRATNSGVSVVIDPAGAVVGELADATGRRKMARGTLAVTVPVPRAAERTLWVRSRPWQVGGWCALVGALLALSGAAVTRAERRGNGGDGPVDPPARRA